MREQSYLVLLALTEGPLHGYGVIKVVQEITAGRVRLGAGTLYSALDRLAAEGLAAVTSEEVVEGRHRRYYELTGQGRQVLAEETERVSQLANAAQRRLQGLRPAHHLGM